MAHPDRAATIALGSVLALVLPADGTAQRVPRPPAWYAEAAIAVARPFVEDGNGTSVKPGVGPVGGVMAAWPARSRTMVTLGVQGSAFSLKLEDGGASWSGGRALQLDIMAGVEYEIAGCAARDQRGCTSLRGAAGGTWLSGSDDVLPFRFGGTGLHPAGELGVTVRLLVRRPLSATLVAHAFRLGGSTANDPISNPGTALQFRLGARYGL